MAIQTLPNPILGEIFQWLKFEDLGRISQASHYWKHISYLYVSSACDSLREEINEHLIVIEKIYKKDSQSLIQWIQKHDAKIANETKLLTQASTALTQLQNGSEEDKKEEPAISQKINQIQKNIAQFQNLNVEFARRAMQLQTDYEDYLPEPNIVNSNHPLQIYKSLFNEKLTLLTKMFNFCILETDQEEWVRDLPKVIDLTLFEGKKAMHDLVIKKIKNFGLFIKPQFESQESFNKFTKFTKFHQIMQLDENIDHITAKQLLDNRLQELIIQPVNLNTLTSVFTPLRESVPFFVEQPNEEQTIDAPLQPFPTIKFKTHLMNGGALKVALINAQTNQKIDQGIFKKRGINIGVNSMSFTLYVDQVARQNEDHRLLFEIGPFLIQSRKFKVSLE